MKTEIEQDEFAEQLGHVGQAEFLGFAIDISAKPRQAPISKRDREEEAAESNWRRFQEDCELRAAGGRIPVQERLRSERTEPGQGEPLEKAVLGELPAEVSSTAFRPGRADLPLEKTATLVGNRGGQAPPRSRFERPADAGDDDWYPGDEDVDKGLRTSPRFELELQK